MSGFTKEQIAFLEKNIELAMTDDGGIYITATNCDVWGNVEGDVWGNVEGSVWGNVENNVWGDVKGDVKGRNAKK